MPDAPNTTPKPIATSPRDKRFLGLILADGDGGPFWEAVELVEWHGDRLLNHNTNNYSDIGKHLTHWLPEPPLP